MSGDPEFPHHEQVEGCPQRACDRRCHRHTATGECEDGDIRAFGVLRERGGESLTGVVGIGFITGLISLAGIGLIALGVWAGVSGAWAAGAPLIAVGFVVFILGITIGSVLRAVFTVAVYRFATEGKVLGPYSEQDLVQAFRPRTGRI